MATQIAHNNTIVDVDIANNSVDVVDYYNYTDELDSLDDYVYKDVPVEMYDKIRGLIPGLTFNKATRGRKLQSFARRTYSHSLKLFSDPQKNLYTAVITLAALDIIYGDALQCEAAYRYVCSEIFITHLECISSTINPDNVRRRISVLYRRRFSKKCTICKVEKVMTDFPLDTRLSGGIASRCKSCNVKMALLSQKKSKSRKS